MPDRAEKKFLIFQLTYACMRRVSGHEMPEHVVYTLLSDVHFACLCLFPFFMF